MLSPLLPLVAHSLLPLYGRDLVLCGYRATDLLRVYALNLVLLPVNLAGIVGSLRQAITGRPIPFHRTPKLADRTAVPAVIVLANYALVGWWAFGATMSVLAGSESSPRSAVPTPPCSSAGSATTSAIGQAGPTSGRPGGRDSAAGCRRPCERRRPTRHPCRALLCGSARPEPPPVR